MAEKKKSSPAASKKKSSDSEIEYEIVEHLGTLGEPSDKGWVKEVNLISWNGAEPKWDIRPWFREGEVRMGKGITLTDDEVGFLKEILDSKY